MESVIQSYHASIPLSSRELYFAILKHRPGYALLRDLGFPVTDAASPDRPVSSCAVSSAFGTSPDPARQRCQRCRKPLSLLDEAWHEADGKGCRYHPGKRLTGGLYTCCMVDGEKGCRRSDCHVCDFRPARGGAFARAPARRRGFQPRTTLGNVFALDCEMAYTTAGLEVVRASLVDWRGAALYDSLVLPGNPVLDLNTAYSGVRPGDLEGVATTLPDVQARLLEILDADSILVGHGLENDLLGLHLCHQNVVDSSLVFGHEWGFPYRHSLRYLASEHLHREVHASCGGHNSVEDARTSLALVLHKVYLENQYVGRSLVSSYVAPPVPPQKPVLLNIEVAGYFSCPLCPSGAYPGVMGGPIPIYVHFETPTFPVVQWKNFAASF